MIVQIVLSHSLSKIATYNFYSKLVPTNTKINQTNDINFDNNYVGLVTKTRIKFFGHSRVVLSS